MSKKEKEDKSITALRQLIKETILAETFKDKAFIKSDRRRKRFKKQFADKETPRVNVQSSKED